MLETATTSSIRNTSSVFDTMSKPDGWIRMKVHDRPNSRSIRMKRVRQRRVAAGEAGSFRKRRQLVIITACTPRMTQVQIAAASGLTQRLDSRPATTTSSTTTSEADSRVWAYWRSNSWSKAGRVPLVEVRRSRASRTRWLAARRPRGWGGAGCSVGTATTSGLSPDSLIDGHALKTALGRNKCSILISGAKELRGALNSRPIRLTNP